MTLRDAGQETPVKKSKTPLAKKLERSAQKAIIEGKPKDEPNPDDFKVTNKRHHRVEKVNFLNQVLICWIGQMFLCALLVYQMVSKDDKGETLLS